MTTLSITGAIFTHAEQTANKLAEELGLTLISDETIMDETARRHGIKKATLEKVIENKAIAFNDFTHEREKCLACLRKTLAAHMLEGNILFYGLLGHLIPNWVFHAMRILIVSDKQTRIQQGVESFGYEEKQAAAMVNQADRRTIVWTNSLFEKKAWDKSLYDIVIPSDKTTMEQSVKLITENIPGVDSDAWETQARDMELAADVSITLADAGTGLVVFADSGDVTVTIEKNVMMLSMFKQKITRITRQVPGVKSVTVKIGKKYYTSGIVRRFEVQTPLNVLLVDDEKEFVQTLSERLRMRQVESSVVFSGADALQHADTQDTEVMVLDLKMPGVDGFEVLKKIKANNPEIEVIILTGHGSKEDKKTCMELGAFAYLQKPADIDILTDTMRMAYEKIAEKKIDA